jgi:hypothetical protein
MAIEILDIFFTLVQPSLARVGCSGSAIAMRFRAIPPVVAALLAFLAAWFHSRRSLQLEILALRHQLAVNRCSVPRPRIQPSNWLFWSGLSRL